MIFFYILSSKFRFLKYKELFRDFRSQNIRKRLFWKNMRNVFGVSVSWNITNYLGVNFFYFLGWKVNGSISENIKNFLIWESESSISRNMRTFLRVPLCFQHTVAKEVQNRHIQDLVYLCKYVDNKLTKHFREVKAKSILFSTKFKTKNFYNVNII